jgi:hypothetical protein
MVIAGVRIAHIPNPHRNPGPFRKLCATGPPHQTVIMYGEEVNPNIRPLFFKDEVSAMKIERQ